MVRHQSLTRTIRREILFTNEEWKQIEERYRIENTRSKSFSSWARDSLMNPFTINVQVSADTDILHEQIRGIASNINQITRIANTNKTISQESVNEVQRLLQLMQETLDKLSQENLILIENQAAKAYKDRTE